MTSETVRVSAKYFENLRVKHLSIEPELLGAEIKFSFDGKLIRLTLPARLAEKRPTDYDNVEAQADVWNAQTGKILNVHVYSIGVAVEGIRTAIPKQAALHSFIDSRLFNEKQTKRLDEQSDNLHFLALRANQLLVARGPLEDRLRTD